MLRYSSFPPGKNVMIQICCRVRTTSTWLKITALNKVSRPNISHQLKPIAFLQSTYMVPNISQRANCHPRALHQHLIHRIRTPSDPDSRLDYLCAYTHRHVFARIFRRGCITRVQAQYANTRVRIYTVSKERERGSGAKNATSHRVI